MLVQRALKIRLYPTQKQANYLNQVIGNSRFIYNQMLNERINYYNEHRENKEELYKHKYKTEKQINVDLSSLIIGSKNRGLINLDIVNIDKSVLINIARLSKKYEKYKVLDNGKNEISIIFPNSKFWKSHSFNWMPVSNRY